MVGDIRFDFTELDRLSVDLSSVPANAGPWLRKGIEVTARKIKDSARASVGSASWVKAGLAINYDVEGSVEAGTLEAEIGYDKGGAGNLGNLREFGAPGSPNALGPHNDLQTTLHEHEDDFVVGVSISILNAQREAGL